MIYCSLLLVFVCQSVEPDAQLTEINAKISEVSDGFAELSSELILVHNQNTNDITVADALETADELAASIEELLSLLPEPPPSSGSGSGMPSQSQPQSGEGEQPQQITQQPQSGGEQEDPNGSGQRTPPPQSIFAQQQQFGDWGNLPPRLEQALQHSDPNDMPLRYRRLLIKYHRQATEPER